MPCDTNFKGIKIGYDPIPIDQAILQSMQKEFEIDPQYAAKCIQANKHNHVSATYYLLLKEKIKKGEVSIADVRQPDYNPNLFVNTRVSSTGVAPSKRRNRLENTSIQIEEDDPGQLESAFKLAPKGEVRASG